MALRKNFFHWLKTVKTIFSEYMSLLIRTHVDQEAKLGIQKCWRHRFYYHCFFFLKLLFASYDDNPIQQESAFPQTVFIIKILSSCLNFYDSSLSLLSKGANNLLYSEFRQHREHFQW